jgi:hypothetical protein
VAAFFHRSQLVLEVDARGTRFDHRLHQLEGIEDAAKACFRVGNDGREEIHFPRAFHVLDLVGADERVVDLLDDGRHGIDRIQRLVGVHFTGDVRVGGDLPAGQIDRLEPGLDLLHRLIARHGA